MRKEIIKIVIFVPKTHWKKVLKAIGGAGAGRIGKYDYCSCSTEVTSIFCPNEGALPHIGKVGRLEEIKEMKIETLCFKKDLKKIISEVKKVHPFDTFVFETYKFTQDPIIRRQHKV